MRHIKRALLALLIGTAMPTVAHAQLGALKKKLKEKVGLEQPESEKARGRTPVQWKEGERIAPLTADGLVRFIKAWNRDQEYSALSPKERERIDLQDAARADANAAKESQQEACRSAAVSAAVMMELGQRMQQRTIQLAQAGDPNPSVQAGQEFQAALSALMDKKCGPGVSDEGPRMMMGGTENYKMREWICAYTTLREELGAEKAAAMVLASPSEVKLIEAHLETFQRLCAAENGPPKAHK